MRRHRVPRISLSSGTGSSALERSNRRRHYRGADRRVKQDSSAPTQTFERSNAILARHGERGTDGGGWLAVAPARLRHDGRRRARGRRLARARVARDARQPQGQPAPPRARPDGRGPPRLPPERDRPQPRQPPQPHGRRAAQRPAQPVLRRDRERDRGLRVGRRLPAADHHRRPPRAARAGDARGAARVPPRRPHPRLPQACRRRRSRRTSARCRASSSAAGSATAASTA